MTEMHAGRELGLLDGGKYAASVSVLPTYLQIHATAEKEHQHQKKVGFISCSLQRYHPQIDADSRRRNISNV